jgi:ABC-type transport system substrate-binding protein
MNARTRGFAGLAAAALAAGVLAACSSSSPAKNASGAPLKGGTLRVISNTGPGSLDPIPTYNFAGYELERGLPASC